MRPAPLITIRNPQFHIRNRKTRTPQPKQLTNDYRRNMEVASLRRKTIY